MLFYEITLQVQITAVVSWQAEQSRVKYLRYKYRRYFSTTRNFLSKAIDSQS